MGITTKKFLIWIFKDLETHFNLHLTETLLIKLFERINMLPVAPLVVHIEVLNGKQLDFNLWLA